MNKKLFLVKEKKDSAPKGYKVPRHPEFVFVRSLSEHEWEARSTESNEIVRIVRLEKGNFYEYEVEKTSDFG